MSPNRRQFNQIAAGVVGAAGMGILPAAELPGNQDPQGIPLGFDNFSIRAKRWKAPELLEFAAKQHLDYVLFSDLGVFENLGASHLSEIKSLADGLGIRIQTGTGSICPTASNFRKQDVGDATDHLVKCIHVARQLGSNVVRCYLGSAADRRGNGGIQVHIRNTVKVLKSVRALAQEHRIKIAVENHAGDMQAHELVQLVKSAGEDFVGVTLDSGNSTWTLEDPLQSLEILGPYAVCSGIRDSVVWSTQDGIRVAWKAVGEGQTDWAQYVTRFARLCPGVPFQLETISGFNKHMKWFEEDFWKAYPDMKAADFARFYRMTFGAEPVPRAKANDPDYQMGELIRSIQFCKQKLKLGLKKSSQG